jgi:metal-responsive CopG/Arc/MetJ family transcriptional regulator
MKVAISLPDPLFTAAEELAGHLRVSRSQLYARALSEYLAAREGALITQRLNAVYGSQAEGVGASALAAQIRALDREAW